MKKYDIVVIGAGSGGLVACTTANRLGFKTALIEKNKIGGECTHYGCVPSKALLNSAKLNYAIKHRDKYGISGITLTGQADFSAVMEHVSNIVEGVYDNETPDFFITQGIDTYVHKSGARFTGKNTLVIGEEDILFNNAIICTGSSPRIVDAPGSEEVPFLHNENFWELRKLPKSIVFIGGGVISAEIGQALVRLGSDVTILERNPRILKVIDEDITNVAIPIFQAEGINVITNATLTSFRTESNQTMVCYNQQDGTHEIPAEKVFIASGRNPNCNGMNLENTGVEYGSRGIATNNFLQTSNPNIYACGDVTTPLKFTHTASHQANIVVRNIAEGNVVVNDLSIFPWAVFTEPEIGHVGMSEKEAREKLGSDVQVFRVDATIDRFITDTKTVGFLKVLFDKNNLVIGADAIGAHAGEWIQLLTVAIKNKISAETMADTIFIYPTYSEIVKKAFSRFVRTLK